MFLKTSHSHRRAIGNVKDVIARAKELDYPCAPIADIASTWAWTEWRDEAEKAGLRPVFAVQIGVSPNVSAKKPIVDYWTFVAKDSVEPLNRLVALAGSQFRYQPLISYKQAMEAENVFKITGHNAQFEHFADLRTSGDDVFVGLSPACARGFITKAVELGFPFCAMHNQHFINQKDLGIYEMVCGRNASAQTYPQYIISNSEWREKMAALFQSEEAEKATSTAYTNLRFILDHSIAALPQADIVRPETEKTLREMCIDGANKIGIVLDEVYSDRLTTEIDIIEAKNFQDYFFVVADMMQFARKHMLCGPGRGSSAGSLVAYLLGITSVDPIKHGLLFFRFIDPARPDWPDIDSDVSSEKRELVFDYLRDKYGEERFAQVGAEAFFQTKNALNEICQSLAIPRYDLNNLENKAERFVANDERKLTALKNAFETNEGRRALAKYPELEEAITVIGSPTHTSTHAAGVVIADRPVLEFSATAPDKNTGRSVLQMNKDTAEKRGAVKIDLLGLTNLAIFEQTLELAGLDRDILESLDLADQKAFDVLNEGKFIGTFQFEGQALQGLTRQIHVDRFDDLVAISALARPGPLSSGAAQRWVDKRNGKREIDYPHDLLKPYLESTYGELVMQEQVMLIAREVAGMDWALVSKMRKAIGKSLGEEALAVYGEPFIAGLVAKGIDEETAAKFWREIVGFGSYALNLSHAVSYGIVTYWSLWLKAYYPLEYAAANLTYRDNTEKQVEFLREMAAEGVSYTPVDPEHSTDKWRVVNGKLIGPLQNVKGLGPKMAQTLLSARARGEPLPERAQKLLNDATTEIDILHPISEALAKVDWQKYNVFEKPGDPAKLEPDGTWQEGLLVAGLLSVCCEESENTEKRIQERIDRGQQGAYDGEHRFVKIRLASDKGDYYCKLGRRDFEIMGKPLLEKAEEGKSLAVIRGTLCPDAPVLLVRKIKVLEEKL